MAGYSGTPLSKKLGIKPGSRVYVKDPPAGYRKLLVPLPARVSFASRLTASLDCIHLFTSSRLKLTSALPVLTKKIKMDGAIWISWPKKASGVATDVTEDVIRHIALPLGLVDVKVCAVDETWSGLKLVIRKSHRK
ncbi:MAG TPA: DUF3052 domain-containing protein [Gammaproteobacteria bacterium]|nr:DUF3052 domain-containing protein [Gammaproteobacteria bacterium]